MTTGTVTTEAQLAAKARSYVSGVLAEATFQQFMSIFEFFFFDLLRLWLTAYPQSLEKKEVRMKIVLDASSIGAVVRSVVDKELNEVAYKRPHEWFVYLDERAKLGCPTKDEIDRISEAKASRDVLAHNRGIANKTYESKSGATARYKDGDRVEIPEQTWELVRKVISDLSATSAAKLT
jgi:hypothetical protein